MLRPAVVLPMEDYPTSHVEINQLRSLVGGADVALVPRTGMYPTARCYANVEGRVAKFGGSSEVGWAIRWFPGVYIEAMHHAVWRMPNNTLLDVTEPQPGNSPKRGVTTFIPEEFQASMARDPLLTQIFLLLVEDDDIRAAIECYRQNHRSRREMQAIQARDPMYLAATHSPLVLTEPESSITARLEALSSNLVDSYNRLHQHNETILSRYHQKNEG